MIGSINPIVDYSIINRGVTFVKEKTTFFQSKGCRIEIPVEHRYWEYGSAIELAWRHRCVHPLQERTKVLNVGCGWDAVSPSLATENIFDITDCEPDDTCRNDRKKVNEVLVSMQRYPIKLLPNGLDNLPQEDFDIVYCISVVEHVDNEIEQWKHLADRVDEGGTLFITCDCIPDPNKPYTFDHMRRTNYTMDKLKARIEMICEMGFNTLGEPDYIYHGNHVYDYSFFRVGFQRV
jgi:2-polyprenyl-3-methyl-5-hydroxy-6-metoxy-1,4-benzoquinol methylase